MRKLTHEELLLRQSEMPGSSVPMTAVLNNIRSLYNVGSMFRTADAAGMEKLWLCGITGIPPSTRISKTALDAEKQVPWEFRAKAAEAVLELKSAGYEIVLLEQMEQSVPYYEYEPEPGRPVCLIVGNEISGISDNLLSLSDRAIEIEMAGLKNSLNVTVAFGIAVYHIRRRILQQMEVR